MHIKHGRSHQRSENDRSHGFRGHREAFRRHGEELRAEFTLRGGRHGSGHFGHRGFGHGMPDDLRLHGMPRFGGRRRVGRGDVRGAILRLLAEGGSWNGYQIIQELTNRSGDAWKPSPGSIYPALQQLQDEGLILAEEQDNKRSYSLTEEGKTAAAKLGDDAAPWEVAAEGIDTDAAELRNLIPQVNVATMQVIQAGSKAQIERAKELLTATRRSLYRILADDEPATE